MNTLTLRELCTETGISRRAVQGYEKAGLVAPIGKNKYGYLLYQRQAAERVREIRFYQEIGFSIREICSLIDGPSAVKRAALAERVEALGEERERLKELIDEAKRRLELLA